MSLSRPKYQSFDNLNEAQHYTDRSLPKMGATTVRLAPLLLEVPLFSVARNAAPDDIDSTWSKPGRGSVRYRGPVLSQAHQTLLLNLVHVRAGQVVSDVIEFAPHELLALMGWSTNSRNTERLAEMVEDLFNARMDVWGPDETERSALSARFIATKRTPTERGARWSITLSETILTLFQGHLSNINIRKRAELREGLATFLYGYLCANDGKVPFKLELLREASGSQTKRLAAFAEQVTEALDTLVVRGCVGGFKVENGAVRVH